MRSNRLAPTLALVVAAVTMLSSDVARAACEIPLVIHRTAGEANVLIILDSSGSMNEAMTHDSYNMSTNYSGNFTGSQTYTVANDGTYCTQHHCSSRTER